MGRSSLQQLLGQCFPGHQIRHHVGDHKTRRRIQHRDVTLGPLDRSRQHAFENERVLRGIATHQNFRKDKTDIGPAFPLTQVAPSATSS